MADLIVIEYDDVHQAEEVRLRLQRMQKDYLIDLADAGIDKDEIQAAWLSTAFDSVNVGPSGVPLAVALRLPYIPVTRVENYCASGTEAFRGAVYAVASGAW